MAITNGYLTVEELKADVRVDDLTQDDVLERVINAASRAVDAYCGERFWLDPSDTTRYYTPHNYMRLDLRASSSQPEDATVTTVTSVTADMTGDGSYDETFTEGTDFVLSPRGNAESDRPYTRLQMLQSFARYWPVGIIDGVKVVGTFGTATVPDEVKEATAIQAQTLFKRLTEGAAPIVTMDGVTLPGGSKFLDANARMLLFRYADQAIG